MKLCGDFFAVAVVTFVSMLLLTNAPVQTYGSTASSATALIPSSHIIIIGDENFTSANGVVSGDGSPSNPYVIEGLIIDFEQGDGISVRKTSAHFVIRNVEVRDSSSGIVLYNVTNGRIENSTLRNNSFGVHLRGCVDCAVVNNTFIDNYYGIFLWQCDIDGAGNEFVNNHIDVFREVKEDYWSDVMTASTVAIVLFSLLASIIIALVYFRRKSMRGRFD